MRDDDRFVRALISIRNVLGPDTAGCHDCCEGCQEEMGEALRLANTALGFLPDRKDTT